MLFWVKFLCQPEKKKLPADQKVTDRILVWGIDHPGIRSTNPELKLETYTLTVDGEVEDPVKLNWNEFMGCLKPFQPAIFIAWKAGVL